MFLFTTSSMFPSAKTLARSLSLRLGSKVFVSTRADTTLRGPVIRWGTSLPLVSRLPSIQGMEFVSTCANKRSFSNMMETLKIPCVEIRNGIPESYPIVLRRTLTGYGGAGISMCLNSNEWGERGGSYWSKWYNLDPELGVHIFAGKILKIFKKVRETELPQEQYPIRNAKRGYHFSLVKNENYPKLIPFVETFYKEFPILFGRMDVGWDRDNKTYRIIEFNTAPCLTQNQDTLEAYTDSLLGVL